MIENRFRVGAVVMAFFGVFAAGCATGETDVEEADVETTSQAIYGEEGGGGAEPPVPGTKPDLVAAMYAKYEIELTSSLPELYSAVGYITVRVTNIGTATAPASKVSLRVCTSATWCKTLTAPVGTIAAGAGRNVSFSLSSYCSYSEDDFKYVADCIKELRPFAKADFSNLVIESNESNNTTNTHFWVQ